MKAKDLKSGQKIVFTPTNKVLEISTVTDKKVSWWFGGAIKSHYGKNTMRRATTSLRIFQKGLDDGTYLIQA